MKKILGIILILLIAVGAFATFSLEDWIEIIISSAIGIFIVWLITD